MQSYINKFEIKMQVPATQEEKDRKDNVSAGIGITNDIMNLLGDVEDPVSRLKMTKTLLSSNLVNPELIELIEEEIQKMEEQGIEQPAGEEEDLGDLNPGMSGGNDFDIGGDLNADFAPDLGEEGEENFGVNEEPTEEGEVEEEQLPSMAELGKDFTDNTEEF